MPIELVIDKPSTTKPRIKVPFLPAKVKDEYYDCVSNCYNPFLSNAEIKNYCAIYSWYKVTGYIPTNKHLELLNVVLTKNQREHLEALGYIKCRKERGMYYCEPIKDIAEVCRWNATKQ